MEGRPRRVRKPVERFDAGGTQSELLSFYQQSKSRQVKNKKKKR